MCAKVAAMLPQRAVGGTGGALSSGCSMAFQLPVARQPNQEVEWSGE